MRLFLLLGLGLMAACAANDGSIDDGFGLNATPAQDAGHHDAAPQKDAGPIPEAAPPANRIKTVFLILMENHSWSTISSCGSATYINNTLVPMGGHAENYSTPPGNHPSELNYLWLEAGSNLGVTSDDDPAKNHQATKDHLSAKLTALNVPWKAYVEDISGTECPLSGGGKFAPRHVPQLYFDDLTDGTKTTSQTCIQHVRPYTELATDLQKGSVARYNFITPNLCNDMHGLTLACALENFDEIGAGDTWLSTELPKIMASEAYKDNGVIFVVWDEGDEPLLGTASDGPIPLLVLSPKAKAGYASTTKLTHSSLLRTLQEIFGVTPLLGDAANATDLSEFFTSFP
jgi:hypothetical protein